MIVFRWFSIKCFFTFRTIMYFGHFLLINFVKKYAIRLLLLLWEPNKKCFIFKNFKAIYTLFRKLMIASLNYLQTRVISCIIRRKYEIYICVKLIIVSLNHKQTRIISSIIKKKKCAPLIPAKNNQFKFKWQVNTQMQHF